MFEHYEKLFKKRLKFDDRLKDYDPDNFIFTFDEFYLLF